MHILAKSSDHNFNNMTKPEKAELPVLAFPSQEAFAEWLAENHETSNGIWMRFYKKASNTKTVVYSEALDEALCYGWIDGQLKSYDENSYLHKFTPRRAKSIWSKRNIEYVARLEAAGKMKPSGKIQVEAAKSDGRWEVAYDSPSKMEVPEDFLAELSKNKKTLTFFESLNRANKYAITWRLQTAKKAETRAKRMQEIIAMLERGEMIHLMPSKKKKDA